jgi:hypothetical protein
LHLRTGSSSHAYEVCDDIPVRERCPCPAPGFVKIRYFGLLANRNRSQALTLCRFHISACTPDCNTLLTEQQNSAPETRNRPKL